MKLFGYMLDYLVRPYYFRIRVILLAY